ncbi:MAG: hypothetical protein K8T89_05530 [Planctomycetes bacterium]|nr:hypothetical protein [Planctomycetota bacterium]
MSQTTQSEPFVLSEKLQQLLLRAEQGDIEVLPALRMFLDEHPEFWKETGDLGHLARQAWTSLAAGPNLIVSESVGRKFEEVRAAAAGTDPGPLEAILAQQVAMTWLRSNYLDVHLAQNRQRGLSVGQAAHLHRLQDLAQRQHMRALKTLATVRRLLPAPSTPDGEAEADLLPHPPEKHRESTAVPGDRFGKSRSSSRRPEAHGRKQRRSRV